MQAYEGLKISVADADLATKPVGDQFASVDPTADGFIPSC